MHSRLRFRLSSLMVVVTVVALAFVLDYWLGLTLAIFIAALPFSLIAERLMSGPRKGDEFDSRHGSRMQIGVVAICALSTAVGVWISIPTGAPTLISPWPFLLIFPALCGVPIPIVVAIPVLVFVILHWDEFRRRPSARIPHRFSMLLAIATGLSASWLAGGWNYGLDYQGREFTIWIVAINVALIASLWFLWVVARHTRSFGWRIAFGTLLHYWLFGFAFPWLGELP